MHWSTWEQTKVQKISRPGERERERDSAQCEGRRISPEETQSCRRD